MKSLADLAAVRQQLLEQQVRAEAERLAAQEAARLRERQQNLFRAAVGQVQPLAAAPRAAATAKRPAPVAVQHLRDEQEVLRSSLSDAFDPASLLETDAELSYARSGVGADVLRKLRKGEWAVQREIDLHGLRREEAREALAAFIRQAHLHGIRCVRVVHGKGLGSPDKTPVLKARVHSWLAQKRQVMAFVQARPLEGGAGAVLVLLG